jgi:hypothetical protein
MNKVLVLILFALSFSAQAQLPSKEELEVMKLSKDKFRWMIHMQFDSLSQALDDRLMFIHSNGWVENKQQFMDDIRTGKLRYNRIESYDVFVRVYGKSAVLTGKGKFNVQLDGSPLDITLFYTEVYVKENKKWLLASRHSNRLP